jgi:phage terminase large subunit GpA-like protein
VQGKIRTLVYPVGVDTAKDLFLKSQIRETRRGPGYVHLPKIEWCDEEELKQLTW